MALKFKCNNDWRERKAQEFDKDKITVTMAGKTYNQYDKIQEAREDTEILETLKKYGCIEGHIIEDPNKMYADFTGLTDLRGIKDAQLKAEELFYNLPLEDRQYFNNNINEFTLNGKEYLEKKIQEHNNQNLGDSANGQELGE